MSDTFPCEICGNPVIGYQPKYCCSGFECGCLGLPIEPCTCSRRCDDAIYDHIGLPFDKRRELAGIEKWHHAPTEHATEFRDFTSLEE